MYQKNIVSLPHPPPPNSEDQKPLLPCDLPLSLKLLRAHTNNNNTNVLEKPHMRDKTIKEIKKPRPT